MNWNYKLYKGGIFGLLVDVVSILIIFGNDVCLCFSYFESGFVFVIYVSSYKLNSVKSGCP